jgi:putative transcriptional regulator
LFDILKKESMSRLTFNRIKELLVRTGKSNIELAEYMGVKVQTVSSWCTNTNQPEIKTLFVISNFLDIEAGELLTPKKELKEVKRKSKKSKKTADSVKSKKKKK